MPQAIVSEKGWIVIPKEIRDRLGLKKGSRVEVVFDGTGIYIEPVPAGEDKWGRGLLKGSGVSTESLLKERREELEREEASLAPPRMKNQILTK